MEGERTDFSYAQSNKMTYALDENNYEENVTLMKLIRIDIHLVKKWN